MARDRLNELLAELEGQLRFLEQATTAHIHQRGPVARARTRSFGLLDELRAELEDLARR